MAVKKKKRINTAIDSLKLRKIKIKVVGIGGGGASIVCEMAQNLGGASFVVADTDSRVFKKVRNRNRIRVFQFGEKLIGGMGTGMNPEIAQKAALDAKDKISKIFEGQDMCILVGSLGGGVASGAGPVFAEIANNQKNILLGIFTLPFAFEGEKKMKIAKRALEKLRENLSGVIIVPNEKIFSIIDRKTPLKKSLSSLNIMFANWLVDLVEVISRPSLINIDFADLKAILKGQGETLFFGQAVTFGPTRSEEAIKRLFQNPFLDDKPNSVKRILFNIAGGKDLRIKEVEAISRSIAALNEKAKIIFGISQTPNYSGKLKVTLIALSDENVSDKRKNYIVASSTSQQKKVALKSKKNNGKNNSKNVSNDAKKKNNKKSLTDNKAKTQIKIRRSGLEVKQTQKKQEEKEWEGVSAWEVPAFLRNKMDNN